MCKVLCYRYKYTDTNTERVPSGEIKIKGEHKQTNYSKCHYNYMSFNMYSEGHTNIATSMEKYCRKT